MIGFDGSRTYVVKNRLESVEFLSDSNANFVKTQRKRTKIRLAPTHISAASIQFRRKATKPLSDSVILN